MEWTKKKYNDNYTYCEWASACACASACGMDGGGWERENGADAATDMPWIEDKYLQWFGENKTSYTVKEDMKSTKITGDKNIDAVQDGLAEGVGGQFSSGGLLGGIGDMTSKEGVNRAERGDTGPVDKAKLEKQQKGWGETLSGGFVGGKK
ncbi:hypothetical protein MMC18_006030 [Xylographa bjoerkii]|nr:hypothetical protein [Xylographa bjoerkii]